MMHIMFTGTFMSHTKINQNIKMVKKTKKNPQNLFPYAAEFELNIIRLSLSGEAHASLK